MISKIKYLVSISEWKSHILILYYLAVPGWHKYIIAICIIMGITEKLYLFCNFRTSLLSYPWYILQSDIYYLTLWYPKLYYKCYFMWNRIDWLWVTVSAVLLSVQLVVATCKHVQTINIIYVNIIYITSRGKSSCPTDKQIFISLTS